MSSPAIVEPKQKLVRACQGCYEEENGEDLGGGCLLEGPLWVQDFICGPYGYVVGHWARVGLTVEDLMPTLTPTPGGLLQEAQVQHGSRCPAQERGQVGAGDRAKGRMSRSLGDQSPVFPSNPGTCFFFFFYPSPAATQFPCDPLPCPWDPKGDTFP